MNTELIAIRYHDWFYRIWRLRRFEINIDWFYRMWIRSWLSFDILTGFIVCGNRVDSIWWLILSYVKMESIWYHDWSCCMWILNWFDIMTDLLCITTELIRYNDWFSRMWNLNWSLFDIMTDFIVSEGCCKLHVSSILSHADPLRKLYILIPWCVWELVAFGTRPCVGGRILNCLWL